MLSRDETLLLFSVHLKIHRQVQLDMLPSQTAYPAGFETSTPDWPQFPCFPANVMQVYELHEYTW